MRLIVVMQHRAGSLRSRRIGELVRGTRGNLGAPDAVSLAVALTPQL